MQLFQDSSPGVNGDLSSGISTSTTTQTEQANPAPNHGTIQTTAMFAVGEIVCILIVQPESLFIKPFIFLHGNSDLLNGNHQLPLLHFLSPGALQWFSNEGGRAALLPQNIELFCLLSLFLVTVLGHNQKNGICISQV